jgi:23S rRNA pseudouridine2604 synthase
MLLTVQALLVKKLHFTRKDATNRVVLGEVLVNHKPASVNQVLFRNDTVFFEDECIYQPPAHSYLACYKPRGIECTYNPSIPQNLLHFLPTNYRTSFPVGRLDKESEGLLFLTNDGFFSDRMFRADYNCQKEYVVKTTKKISDESLSQLEKGIIILGKQTLPCKVFRLAANSFSIVLTQGINRQIRRMCYKLGHEVCYLKRIRIASYCLADDVEPGNIVKISLEKVSELLEGKWPPLTA